MNNSGIAAVLSILIPGLGQIYNGHFLWAVFWFALAGVVHFVTAGLLGWVVHIFASVMAYQGAKNPG